MDRDFITGPVIKQTHMSVFDLKKILGSISEDMPVEIMFVTNYGKCKPLKKSASIETEHDGDEWKSRLVLYVQDTKE